MQEVSDSDDNLEELVSAEDDGILDEPQETIDLKAQDDNDEILETKNSSTPIVPVYDADIPQEDMVKSDPIQQGDTVIHAKYGSGVVEKMIKYGNKTLFSINFDKQIFSRIFFSIIFPSFLFKRRFHKLIAHSTSF